MQDSKILTGGIVFGPQTQFPPIREQFEKMLRELQPGMTYRWERYTNKYGHEGMRMVQVPVSLVTPPSGEEPSEPANPE